MAITAEVGPFGRLVFTVLRPPEFHEEARTAPLLLLLELFRGSTGNNGDVIGLRNSHVLLHMEV